MKEMLIKWIVQTLSFSFGKARAFFAEAAGYPVLPPLQKREQHSPNGINQRFLKKTEPLLCIRSFFRALLQKGVDRAPLSSAYKKTHCHNEQQSIMYDHPATAYPVSQKETALFCGFFFYFFGWFTGICGSEHAVL